MTTLDTQLEAILFFKGEPMRIKELASMLAVDENAINEALETLAKNLNERGITVMRHNDTVQLVTGPEYSELIEEIRKEELSKDLGKAGAEVLAIILYKGPSTRAGIDYVRGVNSTATLRNLMIRGLVEKSINPQDARSYLYKPTLDLLSFLGIDRVEDLPEYESVKRELELFEQKQEELEHDDDEGNQ